MQLDTGISPYLKILKNMEDHIMNKNEMVASIAEKTGLAKKDAEKAFFGCIRDNYGDTRFRRKSSNSWLRHI